MTTNQTTGTDTCERLGIPARHSGRVADLLSQGLHISWLEHPLVAGAIARSKGDPMDVLSNVSKALRSLDERPVTRCVPVSARRNRCDSVEAFRRRLEDDGLSEDAISAILDYEAPALGSLLRKPLAERMAVRQRIAFLRAQGWPPKVIARHMGMGVSSVKDHLRAAA